MNPIDQHKLLMTRRHFFNKAASGVGTAALASLVERETMAAETQVAAKAKRVIYLFQHGAPSQLDLFDYKPDLVKARGTDLPESIRMGQRLTGMTAYQTTFSNCTEQLQIRAAWQIGHVVE